MGKNVRNPSGLKIVYASATEYAEKTLRMGSRCAMCDRIIASVCYVALIDDILYPDCMRALVYSYSKTAYLNKERPSTNEIVNTLLK